MADLLQQAQEGPVFGMTTKITSLLLQRMEEYDEYSEHCRVHNMLKENWLWVIEKVS